MTAVEWLHSKYMKIFGELNPSTGKLIEIGYAIEQAKEIEKEQKQRFNKFLNDEMELGISDKKTIERIHWYYNNYLLTFKSE